MSSFKIGIVGERVKEVHLSLSHYIFGQVQDVVRARAPGSGKGSIASFLSVIYQNVCEKTSKK